MPASRRTGVLSSTWPLVLRSLSEIAQDVVAGVSPYQRTVFDLAPSPAQLVRNCAGRCCRRLAVPAYCLRPGPWSCAACPKLRRTLLPASRRTSVLSSTWPLLLRSLSEIAHDVVAGVSPYQRTVFDLAPGPAQLVRNCAGRCCRRLAVPAYCLRPGAWSCAACPKLRRTLLPASRRTHDRRKKNPPKRVYNCTWPPYQAAFFAARRRAMKPSRPKPPSNMP